MFGQTQHFAHISTDTLPDFKALYITYFSLTWRKLLNSMGSNGNNLKNKSFVQESWHRMSNFPF